MSDQIYELRITLRDTKPPIWRRVAVPAGITLGQLHDVIQIVMGWTNSHMHQFTELSKRSRLTADEIADAAASGNLGQLAARACGEMFADRRFGLEGARNEDKISLAEVCPKVKSELMYEYDFGDGWEHLLKVEKIGDPEPGIEYPVCVAGKLAGPPDDCGGVWGYYEMLEALADPKHETHEEMTEWIGGEFDPEAFDLDEVNKALPEWRRAQSRPRRKRRVAKR